MTASTLTVIESEAAHIRLHHAALLASGTPHPVGACAFLDEEGTCRMYAERPYVCRTQGLPLRWVEEGAGDTAELRDICLLDEEGKPIEVLSADASWSIGRVGERLARLDLAGPDRAARTRLRDLFVAK